MDSGACAQMYPLWAHLTESQKHAIVAYNDTHKKKVSKNKPHERNRAIESFIDAIFNVNDGFIPDAAMYCPSATYNMRTNWTDFLAVARATNPNGARALAALRCPVLGSFFVKPLIFPSGASYDESIIQQITDAQGIHDPQTRAIILRSTIKPNVPLHELLAGFSIPEQRDQADEFGGGKSRKSIRRRRRHKTKRIIKRHSSKKSKRF